MPQPGLRKSAKTKKKDRIATFAVLWRGLELAIRYRITNCSESYRREGQSDREQDAES